MLLDAVIRDATRAIPILWHTWNPGRRGSTIDHMFDQWLEESLGDPSALLHLAEDTVIRERSGGCRKLQVAAAWADCHGAPDDHAATRQSLIDDRFVRFGGIGTPLVVESCPAELAVVLGTSVVAARQLIADALTLRHRLPHLWARVVAGEVWMWKARQVAQRTVHLGEMSSRIVDRLVSPFVEQLAWGRFERCLDATLLQVDEATYQARAELAAARRDARLSRDDHGLAVLVARLEAGDGSAFMALVERVAVCLAEDGDEDPKAVRRSKAFGIIAHQARLRDLLNRHSDQTDDARHPEERVAAFDADPTDPWAADDLPAAGWQTSEHGNYHQPSPDHRDDRGHERGSRTEQPADRWDEPADHCRGCGCGSTFDLRPLSPAELTACRTRAVIHVHVTDQTLMSQHGVLRTDSGPVTLDQFRRWLSDADPTITIRPVLDPAAVAAVDSYEIPQAIREAVHTRHPGSIWPHSPAAAVSSTGGRLDLDHLTPYQRGGPPGQTAVSTLGPLARSEHRAKTVASWQCRQPDLGTYLWRSPHGQISLVTNQGTLALGDRHFAHEIWRAAQPEYAQLMTPSAS